MADKQSSSISEIVIEQMPNTNLNVTDNKSKNEKKLKKNEPKRKSWLSIFSKKKSSPKADKKLCKKSKSLSADETSSISDSNIIPDDDSTSKPNDTAPTLDNVNREVTLEKDNKTTPDKDNKATPDKDNKTTPDKENKMTPDKDNETTPDKDNEKTPDEDDKAIPAIDDETTPFENTEPLIETFELISDDEDVVVKILDEDVVVKILDEDTKSTTKNDTESTMNNISSTSHGVTESTLEKDRSNDYTSQDRHDHLETLVSTACVIASDASNNYDSTDNIECICVYESAVVTKSHLDDEAKLNSEKIEYDKTMEHRLVVLRELVETEMEYVNELSLAVDEILVELKNPRAINYDVTILDDLIGTEKEELVYNNIKEVYEWHRE